MGKIDNLFILMNKKGIKAKKLSDDTGISTGNISDWKIGRSMPSADKLSILADYFNVSVDYLLGREKIKEINSMNDNIYKYFNDEENKALCIFFSKIIDERAGTNLDNKVLFADFDIGYEIYAHTFRFNMYSLAFLCEKYSISHTDLINEISESETTPSPLKTLFIDCAKKLSDADIINKFNYLNNLIVNISDGYEYSTAHSPANVAAERKLSAKHTTGKKPRTGGKISKADNKN